MKDEFKAAGVCGLALLAGLVFSSMIGCRSDTEVRVQHPVDRVGIHLQSPVDRIDLSLQPLIVRVPPALSPLEEYYRRNPAAAPANRRVQPPVDEVSPSLSPLEEYYRRNPLMDPANCPSGT